LEGLITQSKNCTHHGPDAPSKRTMEPVSQALFEGVAHRDYDSLSRLFATNARNAVVSYLSMRQRWASREPRSGKYEEYEILHAP